jgi:hypothetical protein
MPRELTLFFYDIFKENYFPTIKNKQTYIIIKQKQIKVRPKGMDKDESEFICDVPC